MCGTPRPFKKVSPSLPTDELPDTSDAYIKLSFRGPSPSNFIAHLQMALQKKDWKVFEKKAIKEFDPLISGVSGLLKKVDSSQKQSENALAVAFTDIDALLSQAFDLVKLATVISTKITSKTENVDDKVESEFRNMLSELGVSSAITKDSTGSIFHEELSKNLGDFCKAILERKKTHIIPFVDIYCMYNRARGTNLVSPEDLFKAAKLMEFSPEIPVELKLLATGNGLLVIQLKSQNEKVFIDRIRGTLNDPMDHIDALQLAILENISLAIAVMYLHKAEEAGVICRDESSSGIFYYGNFFDSM